MPYKPGYGMYGKEDYRCVIDVESPTTMTLTAIFDMLRYDHARVIDSNMGIGGSRLRLTLSTKRPPTIERWKSFGIFPKAV